MKAADALLSRASIFDIERYGDLPLAVAGAFKAVRVTRLAVEGLLLESDDYLIEAKDLHVLRECAWAAEVIAQEALTLVSPAVAAHPPLGEPVIYGERGADCPVCGGALILHNHNDGHGGSWEDETVCCGRCKARMHGECYWGRVLPLAEWQEHRRQIGGGPEDYVPVVVCAQCRAKDEPA
jgi:hypothetical protein